MKGAPGGIGWSESAMVTGTRVGRSLLRGCATGRAEEERGSGKDVGGERG